MDIKAIINSQTFDSLFDFDYKDLCIVLEEYTTYVAPENYEQFLFEVISIKTIFSKENQNILDYENSDSYKKMLKDGTEIPYNKTPFYLKNKNIFNTKTSLINTIKTFYTLKNK